MPNELKPCPFCGEKAVVEEIKQYTSSIEMLIKCRGCGAELRWVQEFAIHERKNSIGKTVETISVALDISPFEAWNRRVER